MPVFSIRGTFSIRRKGLYIMLYIAANSMFAMALVCSYISDLMELLMFHILVNKCVIWNITS